MLPRPGRAQRLGAHVLTIGRSWPQERYAHWLERTAVAALLED